MSKVPMGLKLPTACQHIGLEHSKSLLEGKMVVRAAEAGGGGEVKRKDYLV